MHVRGFFPYFATPGDRAELFNLSSYSIPGGTRSCRECSASGARLGVIEGGGVRPFGYPWWETAMGSGILVPVVS